MKFRVMDIFDAFKMLFRNNQENFQNIEFYSNHIANCQKMRLLAKMALRLLT